MIYLYTFLIAFFVAVIFVPLFRIIALKCDIIDHPTVTNIKTHKEPTPYLGGLGIWLGFTVSVVLIRFFTSFPTGTLYNFRGIFIAAFIILFLGLIDDVKRLNFKIKFLLQIIAATVLIFYDIKIKFIKPDYLAIIITYIWIIGVTNAFNLIDVMDGLSSGTAFIIGLIFLFINAPNEAIYVNIAAAALSGACLGFLRYNLPPAKIFMGDTGSLFIGIIMSAISLGTNYSGKNNIAVFTPILIMAIPIYDTVYIAYKRHTAKKSIFLGSKDHFALRLQKMGYSKIQILIGVYSVAIFLGIVSYIVTRVSFDTAFIIYGFLFVFGILISKFFSTVKVD